MNSDVMLRRELPKIRSSGDLAAHPLSQDCQNRVEKCPCNRIGASPLSLFSAGVTTG